MLLLDIHSEAVDLQRKHQVSNISLTVLFGWCKILPLIDLNWVVMVLWQKRKVKRNVILSLKTVPLMHLCVIHFIWQSLLAPLFAFELIRMRAYWPLIRLRGMRGSCFRIMWHEHDFFYQRLLGIKYTRMMDRICRLCFSSANHLLFYCISYGHGGLDKKLLSFGDTCSFRPLCPDSVTLAVWLHAQSADLENQPVEPKHKTEREAGGDVNEICFFMYNM